MEIIEILTVSLTVSIVLLVIARVMSDCIFAIYQGWSQGKK